MPVFLSLYAFCGSNFQSFKVSAGKLQATIPRNAMQFLSMTELGRLDRSDSPASFAARKSGEHNARKSMLTYMLTGEWKRRAVLPFIPSVIEGENLGEISRWSRDAVVTLPGQKRGGVGLGLGSAGTGSQRGMRRRRRRQAQADGEEKYVLAYAGKLQQPERPPDISASAANYLSRA